MVSFNATRVLGFALSLLAVCGYAVGGPAAAPEPTVAKRAYIDNILAAKINRRTAASNAFYESGGGSVKRRSCHAGAAVGRRWGGGGAAERRFYLFDILAFYATQNWLQYMINLFRNDAIYNSVDGVAQLVVISDHLKNISDAFDSASIAIGGMTIATPSGGFAPYFEADDLETIDEMFIPYGQSTIVQNLNDLRANLEFFDDVKANGQYAWIFCHWVGDVQYQNDAFLTQMIKAAASNQTIVASWTAAKQSSDAAYQAFLGQGSGFNCQGE
ncbi:hypothetical protein HMN09_00352200 [Mycena chlorophos]|uniref:Uncharacterized protein n=1 Tax=Mycena chlorophos TaxID=658473 RepID=A0A8H6TMK6_MYCCL|nr:hypothetical protein HMN09_00352200 [Mycena chlorophos]